MGKRRQPVIAGDFRRRLPAYRAAVIGVRYDYVDVEQGNWNFATVLPPVVTQGGGLSDGVTATSRALTAAWCPKLVTIPLGRDLDLTGVDSDEPQIAYTRAAIRTTRFAAERRRSVDPESHSLQAVGQPDPPYEARGGAAC